MKEFDSVTKPAHYNQGDIECLTYIRQQLGKQGFISYLEGSIIKYVHRHKFKDSNIQCLNKAKFFLEMLIKEYEDL